MYFGIVKNTTFAFRYYTEKTAVDLNFMHHYGGPFAPSVE